MPSGESFEIGMEIVSSSYRATRPKKIKMTNILEFGIVPKPGKISQIKIKPGMAQKIIENKSGQRPLFRLC